MKKIKFPLEMKDSKQVHDLEELQKYFDLEKAIEYFGNGKLQLWLKNHYEDEILEELEKLTGEEKDFVHKFIEAMCVECQEKTLEAPKIMKRAVLEEKLKPYLNENEIKKILPSIAGSQEEMEALVEQGAKTIYLFNGVFRIPVIAKNIHFIGIGEAKVDIHKSRKDAYQGNNLKFSNIVPVNNLAAKVMNYDNLGSIAWELINVFERFLKNSCC